MAYELTASAAGTGNPYVIATAAIVDTLRASAKQTSTTNGQQVTQRKLGAEEFASMIQKVSDATGVGNIDSLGSVFKDQLSKRAGGIYDILTSQSIATDNSKTTTKRSLICTELLRQGKVHPLIYMAGEESFRALPRYTRLGYWTVAPAIVRAMKRSTILTEFMAYLFRSRYLCIFGVRNLTGMLMIRIGEPTCNLLGRIRYGYRNDSI